LQGLKFRETNLMKMVEESLAAVSCPDRIAVEVKSYIRNEAVWMDHNQMVMVLKDIERNAIEAMPEKGTLTVTVNGNENEIILMVTDTGKGIPEDMMPLLFTPFFTTKPVGDGTGLGLPQAFATIKGHNGDIRIESNTDSARGPTGTTVTIKMPRKQKFQKKDAKIILHEEE